METVDLHLYVKCNESKLTTPDNYMHLWNIRYGECESKPGIQNHTTEKRIDAFSGSLSKGVYLRMIIDS